MASASANAGGGGNGGSGSAVVAAGILEDEQPIPVYDWGIGNRLDQYYEHSPAAAAAAAAAGAAGATGGATGATASGTTASAYSSPHTMQQQHHPDQGYVPNNPNLGELGYQQQQQHYSQLQHSSANLCHAPPPPPPPPPSRLTPPPTPQQSFTEGPPPLPPPLPNHLETTVQIKREYNGGSSSNNNNNNNNNGPPSLGLAVVKQEAPSTSRHVGRAGRRPSLPQVDMDANELLKIERKRARNRVAASKCRLRKLERIAVLDNQASQLRSENEELAALADKLRSQVYGLKQELRWHINNGCKVFRKGAQPLPPPPPSSSSSHPAGCASQQQSASPDSTTANTTAAASAGATATATANIGVCEGGGEVLCCPEGAPAS